MFSTQQVQELLEIAEYFHTLFIATNVGTDVLTQSDKNILTRRGVDWRKMTKDGIVDDAFKFGKLAASLRPKKVKDMTFDQLKKFIGSGKFLPLSEHEKYVLYVVKNQMYKDISNLKNKVAADLYQLSINQAQKQQYEDVLKETAKEAVEDRLSVSEFASKLAEKTGDWNRDFDRIADYILHSVYQHGKANELLEKYGNNVFVYYRVNKDACPHCKRVYLKNNTTGEPKIFRLVNVLKNGSNIGVKAKDYKPSVYALHPWCRCEMEYLPPDMKWNVEKQRFELVRNNYGVNRKSKIKITYG